jgi:hypothetical protein
MADRKGDVGAWENGITLKRTRDGYSWTIAVAAAGDSLEALQAARATAEAIDRELAERYGRANPRKGASR